MFAAMVLHKHGKHNNGNQPNHHASNNNTTNSTGNNLNNNHINNNVNVNVNQAFSTRAVSEIALVSPTHPSSPFRSPLLWRDHFRAVRTDSRRPSMSLTHVSRDLFASLARCARCIRGWAPPFPSSRLSPRSRGGDYFRSRGRGNRATS